MALSSVFRNNFPVKSSKSSENAILEARNFGERKNVFPKNRRQWIRFALDDTEKPTESKIRRFFSSESAIEVFYADLGVFLKIAIFEVKMKKIQHGQFFLLRLAE